MGLDPSGYGNLGCAGTMSLATPSMVPVRTSHRSATATPSGTTRPSESRFASPDGPTSTSPIRCRALRCRARRQPTATRTSARCGSTEPTMGSSATALRSAMSRSAERLESVRDGSLLTHARRRRPRAPSMRASSWTRAPVLANATFTATIQVGSGATRTLSVRRPRARGPHPRSRPPRWPGRRSRALELRADQRFMAARWAQRVQQQDNNPCKQQGTRPCTRSISVTTRAGNADPPSDVVGAVKLTSGPSITSSEVHSAETNTTVTPYVTIGFHSALQPGDWAVLRLRSGRATSR